MLTVQEGDKRPFWNTDLSAAPEGFCVLLSCTVHTGRTIWCAMAARYGTGWWAYAGSGNPKESGEKIGDGELDEWIPVAWAWAPCYPWDRG